MNYILISTKEQQPEIEGWYYTNLGMNMPLGTFCNKLNPKHTTQFTDTEIIRLKGVLIDLRNDLDSVTDIEFNDALKTIING